MKDSAKKLYVHWSNRSIIWLMLGNVPVILNPNLVAGLNNTCFFSSFVNSFLSSTCFSQSSRNGRNSSQSHYRVTDNDKQYIYKYISTLDTNTLSLKSFQLPWKALHLCIPWVKSWAFRQSKNLSIFPTNLAVSSTSLLPVMRSALDTDSLNT